MSSLQRLERFKKKNADIYQLKFKKEMMQKFKEESMRDMKELLITQNLVSDEDDDDNEESDRK